MLAFPFSLFTPSCSCREHDRVDSYAARANLSRLLWRALNGEGIGIVVEGKIVALRPVTVESMDYAMREYGATAAERTGLEKRIMGKSKTRIAGKLHKFTVDIEGLIDGKGN